MGVSLLASNLYAQNIYELRNLSEQDWLNMGTNERLRALNTSNNVSRDQTLVGKFSRDEDLYYKWGYDYYEMNQSYENYAFRGFENYNIVEDRRNKWYYNQFGDRLTKMTTSGRIWMDRANDDGTSEVYGPSGYINSQVGVDGIWVARESTNDWAVSAVAAGALRAKISPLTMSVPNMNGMKVDFQSKNWAATITNSQLWSNGASQAAVMLRGGQVRRQFGALNLGFNYSNMYNQQTSRDGGTDFKGTVHNNTPTPIFYAVRVLDDSPSNGHGPTVQDVKIIVDGVYRNDIVPTVIFDDLSRELITAVNSKSQQNYLQPATSWTGNNSEFDMANLEMRMPKYVDYLYMMDYQKGWNTSIVNANIDLETAKKYYKFGDPSMPITVNKSEYVVYIFDLSSINGVVKRVQAELTVSGDYRVDVSQIFTKKKTPGKDVVGENFQHYRSQNWRTAAEADGKVKDNANMRTIKVDFGYEVANTIYGMDAHFNYLGFKVDGEFVRNTHYYMFADNVIGYGLPANELTDITSRDGHRSAQSDNAYYITMQKDWRKFGLGGEIFKMGKYYKPYMNYFLPDDITGANGISIRNNEVRFTSIEDNDDNDQYPDTNFQTASMANRVQALADPDGVFPGNDLDFDGIPDNDKNYSNIPDYEEPFFMFDTDQDEFVFGDDNNFNSIPDFREDDMKYDTPYELEREGHHFFLKFAPQRNVNFIVGSSKINGVATETRTNNDYLKTNLNYDFLSVGNIYAEYRYERVEDNVMDKYVIVPTKAEVIGFPWYQFSPYTRFLHYDELEYKNSAVQKLFVESKIRAIPSIIFSNHVKYESNRQLEGTMYDETFQPKDTINSFAFVNKLVYTKSWGNLTFSPGMKFRLYKKGRSQSINPLDHYLMRIPMVIVKYTVSPKTTVTLGAQGFKGLELQYTDYIIAHNDYKQTNYIVQIENRTTYFGFDVWGSFGFKAEDVKFDKAYRSFENEKSSTFFVQFWAGY